MPKPVGGAGGATTGFAVRSPAFSDHTLIPDRFSLDGGNTPPPLDWSDVPAGTAELVLVCEDPDAPAGTFTHWLVAGLPADSTGIAEGELPEGAVEGRNDFGRTGWGGPRPPIGDEPHRYFFRLHASDLALGLRAGFTRGDLEAALEGHDLGRATVVGLFGR